MNLTRRCGVAGHRGFILGGYNMNSHEVDCYACTGWAFSRMCEQGRARRDGGHGWWQSRVPGYPARARTSAAGSRPPAAAHEAVPRPRALAARERSGAGAGRWKLHECPAGPPSPSTSRFSPPTSRSSRSSPPQSPSSPCRPPTTSRPTDRQPDFDDVAALGRGRPAPPRYSTVTLLARLRGWSTSLPLASAIA